MPEESTFTYYIQINKVILPVGQFRPRDAPLIAA